MRARLSAMEFDQIRDMAMASVVSTEGGGALHKEPRKPKPPEGAADKGKTHQNVKQLADHMGRLKAEVSKENESDALKAHMARVHRR